MKSKANVKDNSIFSDLLIFLKTSSRCLLIMILLIYFRFVLVNSIALQGDECSMCSEAMTQLMAVAEKLNCHRERTKKDIYEDLAKKQKPFCELPKDSPAPVLIQVSSFLSGMCSNQ